MSKAFASQGDLEEKTVTFSKLSENAYAYTAEGDPNSGIVIGDDAVMVIDTQATPAMAFSKLLRPSIAAGRRPARSASTAARRRCCLCAAAL